MKTSPEHSAPRLKSALRILFFLIVAFPIGTGVQVVWYWHILERESRRLPEKERFAQCQWHPQPAGAWNATPSWWQVVQGARPIQLHYQTPPSGTPPRPALEAVAAALHFFGSLEKISIAGAGDEALPLLAGVGPQPHLKMLYCARFPATDEICQILPNFPGLQELTMRIDITGESFPVMPELRDVDFSFAPITVAGLRALARSPQLTDLALGDHPAPTPELRAAIVELMAQHPQLKIEPLEDFPEK